MKTIFNLTKCFVIAFLYQLPALNAQDQPADEPKDGFIRLANAVAQGTGPLTVEVDGKNINPKGYKLGATTGGVSLSPGSRTIKISREGVKSGTTRVNIVKNETTTMIPFAEKVPATDDAPAYWEIKVLRLKQQDPEKDRSATFVSVSGQPEVKVEMQSPDGNWSSVFVKRLAVAQAPILYTRGYVPLKSGTETLTSIPVASLGNYVILLYDNEEGKMQSLNFQDTKYLSAD